MRKRASAVVVTLAALIPGAALARAHLAPLRLQGTFAMRGMLTTDVDVRGEQPGGHVSRTWNFFPQCATGSCRLVLLKRRRSSQHIPDVVMLERQRRGVYLGQGSFWVPLQCAGIIDEHGGVATETIAVQVTQTQLIGTTRFPTKITATYTNPSRKNLTRCPGEIGHDAARYSGRLTSPLP